MTPASGSLPPTLPAPRVAAPLVLYDGLCGFCDASVQWLLGHDRAGVLRYAPLQGETAAALLLRHPELPPDIDSIVFVEPDGAGGERLSWRSAAVFAICARLPLPWRLGAWLRWLPRPVSDLAYRFVARVRYRLWGRRDACRVPRPEERARFLP